MDACAYCGAALPHVARAAEKVAVVNQLLEDRNQDGIPDIFEKLGGGAPGSTGSAQVSVSTSVMIDGKLVTDPSELPPEAQRALASLGGMVPGLGSAQPGRIERVDESTFRISTSVPVAPPARTSGVVWAIVGALAALVAVLGVLLALR